jgi:hypothetical protein
VDSDETIKGVLFFIPILLLKAVVKYNRTTPKPLAFAPGFTSASLTVPVSKRAAGPFDHPKAIILGGTEPSYRMSNFPFFLLLHSFDLVGAQRCQGVRPLARHN